MAANVRYRLKSNQRVKSVEITSILARAVPVGWWEENEVRVS